jgi:general stress protein CsbA
MAALIATAIYSGFVPASFAVCRDAVDLKAGTVTVKQRADERGVITLPKLF